jgi:uncharacterized membrane protein
MRSAEEIERARNPPRNRWTGLLYALLVGLVGAGIVHIVVLLAIPSQSKRDAWTRLSPVSKQYEIVRVGAGTAGGPVVGAADPSFLAAVCRFKLADGPVRVRASGRVPFWSASVYEREGPNLFSLTDRSATDGELDLVILRPEQMIEVRKNPPGDFERSIYIELPIQEGMILLRVFMPDNSWRQKIETYLAAANCKAQ